MCRPLLPRFTHLSASCFGWVGMKLSRFSLLPLVGVEIGSNSQNKNGSWCSHFSVISHRKLTLPRLAIEAYLRKVCSFSTRSPNNKTYHQCVKQCSTIVATSALKCPPGGSGFHQVFLSFRTASPRNGGGVPLDFDTFDDLLTCLCRRIDCELLGSRVRMLCILVPLRPSLRLPHSAGLVQDFQYALTV